MPAGSSQITLELEGLPQEGGHLRLSDFLAQLSAFKKALHGVDRTIESATDTGIYYRVVGLSHNSPAKIVIEPVSHPRKEGVILVDPQIIHDRFFRELGAISRNEAVSADIDNEALESFQKLVENSGKTFTKAALYNNESSVILDERFKRHVTTLLEKEYFPYGSITGRLETIQLHGRKKSFRIYPEIGPRMVVCTISLPHLKELAKAALEKVVTVRGRKAYRPNSNFPYRIDARELIPVEESLRRVHLADLGGMAGTIPSDQPSAEIIREARDDWE